MAEVTRPGSSSGPARWSGHMVVSGSHGLYLGPTFRTKRHAHHAVQLCIALEGALRVRTRSAKRWHSVSTCWIHSDELHEIDGEDRLVALIFLDPESPAARSIPLGSASAIAPYVEESFRQELLACWRDERPEATLRVCDRLLRSLAHYAGPAVPLDPRIRRVLESLRSAPDRRMPVAALADAVTMSESRLLHLFREQMGVPIRRYLLWLRLGDALRHAREGRSLTEVAHLVGFADSAHLSRTFRRMLGIAPSALHKR